MNATPLTIKTPSSPSPLSVKAVALRHLGRATSALSYYDVILDDGKEIPMVKFNSDSVVGDFRRLPII